jgi:hypothetical protein
MHPLCFLLFLIWHMGLPVAVFGNKGCHLVAGVLPPTSGSQTDNPHRGNFTNHRVSNSRLFHVVFEAVVAREPRIPILKGEGTPNTEQRE